MDRLKVRAVALDLDGTLLTSDNLVTDRTIRALRDFHRCGGLIAIATGRWREFSVAIAKQIGVCDYIVCQDGGLVLEQSSSADGDGWQEIEINMPSSHAAAEIISKIQPQVSGCLFGTVTLRGQAMVSPGYVDLLGESPPYAKMLASRRPTIEPDIETALRSVTYASDHVSFIRVLPGLRGLGAEDLLELLEPVLKAEREHAAICWHASASEWSLDDGTGSVVVRFGGIHKALGLQQLAPRLWEGAEHGKGWMAFGDSWNDLEMLRWAEWSITPGNAKDARTRDAAKEVSQFTNDSEFIALALERELESCIPQIACRL